MDLADLFQPSNATHKKGGGFLHKKDEAAGGPRKQSKKKDVVLKPTPLNQREQKMVKVPITGMLSGLRYFTRSKICSTEVASKVVYRVTEAKAGVSWAAKLLSSHARKGLTGEKNRLRRMRYFLKPKHPGILSAEDFVTHQGSHFLLFPWASGGTLLEYVHSSNRESSSMKKAREIRERLSICRQVASAIGFLHSQSPSLTHLRLKPSNVLIFPTSNNDSGLKTCPTAKVCDFLVTGSWEDKEEKGEGAKNTSSSNGEGSSNILPPKTRKQKCLRRKRAPAPWYPLSSSSRERERVSGDDSTGIEMEEDVYALAALCTWLLGRQENNGHFNPLEALNSGSVAKNLGESSFHTSYLLKGLGKCLAPLFRSNKSSGCSNGATSTTSRPTAGPYPSYSFSRRPTAKTIEAYLRDCSSTVVKTEPPVEDPGRCYFLYALFAQCLLRDQKEALAAFRKAATAGNGRAKKFLTQALEAMKKHRSKSKKNGVTTGSFEGKGLSLAAEQQHDQSDDDVGNNEGAAEEELLEDEEGEEGEEEEEETQERLTIETLTNAIDPALLSSIWIGFIDEESGYMYYYNPGLRETSWSTPSDNDENGEKKNLILVHHDAFKLMQSSSDNELKELKEQGMDLLMKERQRVRELEACISKLKDEFRWGNALYALQIVSFR
eukprot:jgi/Bigna1/82584/fgenesh1_pg.94_\